MDSHTIATQIEVLPSTSDVEQGSAALVEAWLSAGAGLEAVEPILRFMETHPHLDYGPPGPLTHFIERFHGNGYDEQLLASVERQPTPHTIWMLNRLINGATSPQTKSALISALVL